MEYIQKLFLGVADEFAPVTEICIKQRTEPWMNADILNLIDQSPLRFKRSKNESDYEIYKESKKYAKIRN